MDMDNRVGVDCGSRGWAGWWKTKGEKLGQLSKINKNLKKEKKNLTGEYQIYMEK